jgi:crescentin
MTKLVTLLGRKTEAGNGKSAVPQLPAAPQLPSAAPLPPAEPPLTPAPLADAAPDEPQVELDTELFFPLARQLGEENEVVRNLLLDAERKIGELENVKVSIAKLVDPVCNTLRSYEETKNEKLVLQRALNSSRDTGNQLRVDLAAAEKKAASLKAEFARLQETLTASKQTVAALERTRVEQSAELGVQRAHVAELQSLVQQQSSDLRLTRDENRRFGERIAAADQRAVQLESQARTAQQTASQANKERAALQASLDKTLSELGQTVRRLGDAEKSLGTNQARLKATETNLAEVQAERTRLSTALDEIKYEHRDKMNQMNSRLETVQARSSLTEKLLEEARQALTARAEETRTFERRLVESSAAYNVAVEKLSCVEAVLAQRELQIKDLEQARTVLAEQTHKLMQVETERESTYDGIQQKIREQADLVEILQEELNATRSANSMQIENLNAQLQREQLDRSMAEGALEAARKDVSRLLQEIVALKGRPITENLPDRLQRAA